MSYSEKNSYNYFERESSDFNSGFVNPLEMKDPIRKLVKLVWRTSGSAARFEQALKLLPFDVNGKTILEVGCGHGHCSLHLAKMGSHVIGMDFSPCMLEIAENNKRKYASTIKGSCTFKKGNVFTYLPDKHFFLVFALGVIDYIEAEKVDIFMSKMALLSGKWVLVAFPLKPTLFYIIRKIWLRYFKKCDVNHFTRRDIRQICKKSDLKIVKSTDHAGYSLCLMIKK